MVEVEKTVVVMFETMIKMIKFCLRISMKINCVNLNECGDGIAISRTQRWLNI